MVPGEPVDHAALSEQLKAFVAAAGRGELEQQYRRVQAFLQTILPHIHDLGDDLCRDLARLVCFWHDYLGGYPRGLEAAAQWVVSGAAGPATGENGDAVSWDMETLQEFAENVSRSKDICSGELLGTAPSTDEEWRALWKALKEHGGLEHSPPGKP